MIKFFRSARQSLISQAKSGKIRQTLLRDSPPADTRWASKLSKYLFYAFGEIALVVLGILIALQINNWNENKKSLAREEVLLTELVLNLRTNVNNLERDIRIQKDSYYAFDFILDLQNSNSPYNDSTSIYLQDVNFAPDVVLTASAFETLKSSGLELIRLDSLRKEIINLFEIEYPFLMQETRRLENQLWPELVMPLYQKHFSVDSNGWIPNNYQNWLKDREFFNMVGFRKTMRYTSTMHKSNAITKTKEVIRMIESELK